MKLASSDKRSIVDGLSDTDWVLGFLSKHSMRDPGVCLDELAKALHAKGGAIATVLVEGEDAVKPPVSVSQSTSGLRHRALGKTSPSTRHVVLQPRVPAAADHDICLYCKSSRRRPTPSS